MKNKLLYHFGNTLLLLSILGFIVLFYPVVKIYVAPPPIVEATKIAGENTITIPKINAQAPIVKNVDPFNKAEYNEALTKGVAHAEGTSLPGEKGTSFLFAHSSGSPWDMTRLNTIFLRLDELEKGDKITLTRDNKRYTYIVREKKVVLPSEIGYLLQTEKDQLILQTCTPIGTSYKRLLIFADPVRQ